jgi:hypothetical protein
MRKFSNKYKFLATMSLVLFLHSNQSLAQTPWENNLQVLRDSTINVGGNTTSRVGSGNNPLSGGSTFSAFPPLSPKRESLLSTRGSANVSLGCDGINLSTILASRLDEYQKVIEGLVDEAPSFLILWMAYSQPTLASILDQLNIEFGAGLDLATFSCSNAKKFAETNPFDFGGAFGKDGCIGENGGNNSECVGDNAEHTTEAMEKKISDIKEKIAPALEKLKSAAGTVGITTSGGSGSSLGGNSIALSPIKVDSDCYKELEQGEASINFTDLTLLMGQIDCYQHKTYAGLLPVFEINKEKLDSGVVATQREHSLAEIYYDKSYEYYALIHAVVIDSAVIVDEEGKNAKNVKKGSTSNSVLAKDAGEAKALIEAKTRMIFEPYIVELLQKALGKNDADRYTRARSQLASQFAYAEVATGVTSLKTSALNGIAIVQQQRDLPENAAFELTNVLNNLENELAEVEMLKNISAEIIETQLNILNN